MLNHRAEYFTFAVSKLDEKYPGWHNRINVERLVIEDADSCILGQLFGEWTLEKPYEIFDLPFLHEARGQVFASSAYQSMWVDLISARQAGDNNG